ncbi:MAG: aminotransferase class V-fold PLP-dependent enzyme, partial [Myxococcales bacterium]|nr:aminotransferase class V-fold PLP-dependent enzyme [Myxococcales bacterium]
WVNHETGTVFPVEDYGAVARQTGARFAIDGAQALGKVPVNVGAFPVDALAVASSKVGGPAGAGALWIRRGVPLTPQLWGGSQERGRRAGSPDPVTQAGFGAAAHHVTDRLGSMAAVADRRDRLEGVLRELGAQPNGGGPRVATVTNVSVPGWKGDALVAALDVEGLCASAGAACSAGIPEPSAVVSAMYPAEPWRAAATLRLSFGPETTDDEVERAALVLKGVLSRRKLERV